VEVGIGKCVQQLFSKKTWTKGLQVHIVWFWWF
jgi:hypothetical protein